MRDHQRLRAPGGQAKAGSRFAAHNVLHGYCLSGLQQRAVHHGVGTLFRHGVTAGWHVEAPWLDAAVPVAPGEAHVVGGARAHKIRLAVDLVLAGLRLRVEAAQHGHAARVGPAAGEQPTAAVRDLYPRVGDRLALVQRRHPDGCVFAPELEMHPQVGDQCRGANKHRALRAVAFVQQRVAQRGRRDFDHMKAGGQWNAHHFERPRVLLLRPWQVQRLHAGFTFQQRHHARLHGGVAVRLQHPGQGRQAVCGSALALDAEIVVALHAVQPAHDVRIGLGGQRAHLAGAQGLHAQPGFYPPQRDRQQRQAAGAVAVRFRKTLDDAKRRGGKLRQRRQQAGRHL